MNIVEFLKARLAEDAEVASAASDVDGARWYAADPFSGNGYDRVEGSGDTTVGYDMHSGTCPHIARYDPARVLREIAAKRGVIKEVSEMSDSLRDRGVNVPFALTWILMHLAGVYSDHPDFKADWSI